MKHICIMLTLITFIASFAHAANELEDSLILYMSLIQLMTKAQLTIHCMKTTVK